MTKITYTASEPVYVSDEGRMVYPGETFAVEDTVPTGDTWLDEKGEAIPADKRVPKPKKDVPEDDAYGKLSLSDLKAIATARKIPTGNKTKDDLADAIRAHDAEG
ncbi:hypothetical protein LH128_01107 [Sphingomonas sp. LH128]|uniref:hypothetical protein n=1 Tax=Sphingomonas sp. LH128 TaxID=473781 RepID=UPI00027CC1F5|nr:hypothetical protein [Sphingomonas sp. LH128]EJU14931.1 hypothetical protein LH128_01107 [Sphingomonas sp. LH128]